MLRAILSLFFLLGFMSLRFSTYIFIPLIDKVIGGNIIYKLEYMYL